MAESVALPREFIDQMVAHSREDQPNECCGVVATYTDGRLKLFRATNAEASPYRFSIPPGELHYLYRTIEEEGGEVLVVYHSHTMSEARPSPTDANFSRMLEGPEDWPYWLLVSLVEEPPSVRIWQMSDGSASELELVTGDLPLGSSMVQLTTSGEDRKPVVSETMIS